jgi:hypothetical protein
MKCFVTSFESGLGYRFPESERTWTLEKNEPAALEAAWGIRPRRRADRAGRQEMALSVFQLLSGIAAAGGVLQILRKALRGL